MTARTPARRLRTVKGLARRMAVRTMPEGKCVDADPALAAGGYSPMTARILTAFMHADAENSLAAAQGRR